MTIDPAESPPFVADQGVPARRGAKRKRRPAIAPDTSAPQFGTAHLLLWIACTGVYLGANRDLYADDLSPLGILLMIGKVLPRGAAWAALAIFVRRRWRQAPWPIEPGEWLAAIAGAWLALEVLMMDLGLTKSFQNPVAVHTALACLLLVAPTLTTGLTAAWKLYFSFLVAIFAWPLSIELLETDTTVHSEWLYRSGDLVQSARYYLAAAGLALVVVRDWRRVVKHGWLHWAGLVDVVLIVVTSGLSPLED